MNDTQEEKTKKKIVENMAVYSSLRDEILVIEEMQRNVFLYMYSIFAVLYALGVQFEPIFYLVTFIVLIPFQSRINRYNLAITKMSVYIRVFFEEERDDMHWETFQTYPSQDDFIKSNNKTVAGFFSRCSTALLGALASVSFILEEVNIMIQDSSLLEIVIGIVLIIVAIFLAILVCIITVESLKHVDQEVFKMVTAFKEDLEAGHEPIEYRLK